MKTLRDHPECNLLCHNTKKTICSCNLSG